MVRKRLSVILALILLLCMDSAGADPDLTLQDSSVRPEPWREAYIQILQEHSAGIRAYHEYVAEVTSLTDCKPVGLTDLTGDGDVNGSDLVEEISLVMSQSISQAPIVSENTPRLLTPRMTLNSNDCGKAILGVESGESFILSQMALQLSEGQHLTDITTDAHHSVEYRQLSENTYFVLCYSSKNAIFSSNEDLLTVHYTGQGKIYMKDVMMVDNNKQEWHFAPICSNDATGIDWVNRSLSQPTDIYSINGRIVRQQATSLEGLAKGVYLINGNKIIIK